MTPAQVAADNYQPGVREVAPSYDAEVFYAMYTRGDFLVCGKCGWSRPYANDAVRAADKVSHATPVRNPDTLDIACLQATWGGAMATYAIRQ